MKNTILPAVVGNSGKKNLLLWIFLIVSSFFLLISCEKKEVTVTHYKIHNCKEFVNLRSEPNTSSAIISKVPLGTEVQVLRRVHEPPEWEYWAEVKVKSSGLRGYVKENFLKSWTTKEIIEPPTLAERLSDKDQKVTARIFGFLDTVIGKKSVDVSHDILSRTIIKSGDGSDRATRIFWILAAVVVAVIMAASINWCETIQWWHYIIAIVFIAIEMLGFVAGIGPLSINIGIFILDFIVGLIFFLLILSVPALHWYSASALIGNLVGDDDSGVLYVIATMFILLLFVLGINLFPAIGDILFYIYLALNGIVFIVLNIFGNISESGPFRISFHLGYFLSIRGILVFLLKFIISFVSFAILFAFTIYMVLPLIAVSIGLGILVFSGLIVLFTILSPMGMSMTSSKSSSEIRDGAGHFIDRIDSSGWDIGGGGRHYSRGFDGFFRRD